MALSEVNRRLLLVGASALGYALLFALLFPELGRPTAALGFVPAVVAGWLFGVRAGVLVGLLAFPYNALFVGLFLPASVKEVSGLGDVFAGIFVIPLVGGGVGYLSNLNARVKEQNYELGYRASHDALTGLFNRSLFVDRLEHALARGARSGNGVAVLFLDLDNFKVVNDSLGHEAGDELLSAVADRLRGCVRPGDTIARFGGDEFVILLEDVAHPGQASQVADRVARELHAPFDIEGHEVWVTVSVGIKVSAPGLERAQQAKHLLRDADAAMYRAKAGGKAGYRVFKPEMGIRAAKRLTIESELRRGLERGEFVLYYQPLVRLETSPRELIRPAGPYGGAQKPSLGVGRHPIVGVEALVRWEHPRRGLLSPSEFLPVVEETGLIVPIGRWILREACQRAKEWQERLPAGPRLLMFSNVSTLQLQHEGIVEVVREALAESGLDPTDLILEVTEAAMMKDPESAAANLGAISALGVGIALDDFGTGYSSLSYLKRFPVDYLKVDTSFVKELDTEAGRAMVSGLAYLAHVFNVKTIAEGVETSEQLKQLRLMGCDMAQGHRLARPLPGGSVEPLLEKGVLPYEYPAPPPDKSNGGLGSTGPA